MTKITAALHKMIRGMFVGYTSEQTQSDSEVAREYEKDHGDLPANAQLVLYVSPSRDMTFLALNTDTSPAT